MRGMAYVAGVGVVLRGTEGGGVEMGIEGTTDKLPEVVKDVKSRISGNTIRILFLVAYWP